MESCHRLPAVVRHVLRRQVLKGVCLAGLLALCAPYLLAAEPIRFASAEATFHSGDATEFLKVIDGVEFGPQGWSPAPKVKERQALVVRCERPVEADELDITLFFLAGRPKNAIADFALSYTTDAEPSLAGNWHPLEIQRFSAEVTTLSRAGPGRLVSAPPKSMVTGVIPDDVYHIQVLLPGRLASGFRLDVFPVKARDGHPAALSWYRPFDFSLTEFRVARHARESTNIALQRPVKASHPLEIFMTPRALTDGLPATIAHPGKAGLGSKFWFELDLGRVARFDHISLRTRGDGYWDRFSRMKVRAYDQEPSGDASPVWEGMIRADGSHPGPGETDFVRAEMGKGEFRGRYLRVSTESQVPYSPQLAEVEVYETRTPELVSVLADGRPLAWNSGLEIPPGVRRLAVELRVPQSGMPIGAALRWRLPGEVDDWQTSRLMTIDMARPRPGRWTFEAQAMHSDGQWDASLFRLPVVSRQHLWENRWMQAMAIIAAMIAAVWITRMAHHRRTARQLDEANARAALAEERARIARDLHDDLGANLAEIAMISELARESLPPDHPVRSPLDRIFAGAERNARRLGEIVWAVNPANDTLEHFTKHLCRFAQDYLASANIRCRFELPEAMPNGSVTAAQRYHLLLAAKEAVHNAVRHGHPETVTLKLLVKGDRFVVTVRDDGHGCDAAAATGSPRGCGNMRLRMETIGGNFHLASSPGQGTTVVLSTPFSP